MNEYILSIANEFDAKYIFPMQNYAAFIYNRPTLPDLVKVNDELEKLSQLFDIYIDGVYVLVGAGALRGGEVKPLIDRFELQAKIIEYMYDELAHYVEHLQK